MDLNWIWKAVLIVLGGTFLLRIAGRKSISQMTLAQTVIMIGIGSLLIQPLAGKSIWITLAVGGMLVLTLIAMEYGQVKLNWMEKFITGRAKIVIENGEINEKNLKKLRMTVDQLEMNLREKNVTAISDVKWATLEPNGQVGYELQEDAKPVTKKEFQQLQKDLHMILLLLEPNLGIQIKSPSPTKESNNNFSEVAQHGHESPPLKHLQ